MNISYMRSLLTDYNDKRVCDFLEFGFPMGVSPDFVLQSVDKKDLWKFRNHKGATEFPDDINKYLQKEIKQKSILGPFKTCPFSSGIKISPLNSVPKKDSNERRVILDLSYPKGNSVNDFISKEFYLEEKIDLMYSKVDDLNQLIKAKGKGCLLFKIDLRKAFRQLSLCPSRYRFAAYIRKTLFDLSDSSMDNALVPAKNSNSGQSEVRSAWNDKTGLRGFPPDATQTGLYSQRRWLEA